MWTRPTTSIAPGSVCPPPMRNHTACSYGDNKMLLFGGFDGSFEFSDLSLLTFHGDGSKFCILLDKQIRKKLRFTGLHGSNFSVGNELKLFTRSESDQWTRGLQIKFCQVHANGHNQRSLELEHDRDPFPIIQLA